jgi:hypothetical protein
MDLVTNFVQLNPGLQELIVIGITALVSFLLLQLAALSPALADYIGQYKTGIVVWLSGLVFQLLQNQLNNVPANWEAVAGLVMQLIVAVAAVLLGFAGLRRAQVRGAAALK